MENISKLISKRGFHWFIKPKPSGMWNKQTQWKQQNKIQMNLEQSFLPQKI